MHIYIELQRGAFSMRYCLHFSRFDAIGILLAVFLDISLIGEWKRVLEGERFRDCFDLVVSDDVHDGAKVLIEVLHTLGDVVDAPLQLVDAFVHALL